MQWLTCASDRLAKQTHDNCDKHGVIYEMPLLKLLPEISQVAPYGDTINTRSFLTVKQVELTE